MLLNSNHASLLPILLFFQYENVNCDSRADENFRKSDAIVNSKMNFRKYFTQASIIGIVVKGSCWRCGYGWHLRFHTKRWFRLYFSHCLFFIELWIFEFNFDFLKFLLLFCFPVSFLLSLFCYFSRIERIESNSIWNIIFRRLSYFVLKLVKNDYYLS